MHCSLLTNTFSLGFGSCCDYLFVEWPSFFCLNLFCEALIILSMVPISFRGRLKIPWSLLQLSPIPRSSLSFLLQINLLTTVMSDVPVLPDEDDEDALPMLMDSPQCVAFGIFVIWWAHCENWSLISINKRREVKMRIKLPKLKRNENLSSFHGFSRFPPQLLPSWDSDPNNI